MTAVQPRHPAPLAYLPPVEPLAAPELSNAAPTVLPELHPPTRLERLRRKARALWFNTLNTAVYLLSGGHTTLHEGRYSRRRGVWRNWSGVVTVQPQRYETPETEAELCRIVRESTKLRAVGGGHTFNDSTRTEQTLLSLDKYNRVLEVEVAQRRVRVQAGIRLRDLSEVLAAHGLALPVLGSTDAQSLAGLIATDLHGTGREHGFLSEQVLSLRALPI
jgi:FAD/FMN-containing dehydrogenase